MMKLKIYTHENDELIDTIEGETNEECEKIAYEKYWDTDTYYWDYN